MKRFWLASVAALIVLGALLALIFTPTWNPGAFIQHPATTAWAQVTFTVAAIVATWFAGRRQMEVAVASTHRQIEAGVRAAAKAESDAVKAAIRSACVGAAFLIRAVEDATNATRSQSWDAAKMRVSRADVAGAKGILEAVPLAQLPSAESVAGTLNLLRTAYRAEVLLEGISGLLADKKPIPPNSLDDIAAAAAEAAEPLNEAERQAAAR